MPKYQIDKIKILIGDLNRQLRSSLKGVLHQHGFRGIIDVSSVENLEDAIKSVNPDLILCDINLGEGSVANIIRRMRHNEIGQNPFSAVILFIDEPSEHIVHLASEAGVDDLQVKPVIAQNVIDRVEYLIEKRKPFVVTTDYVGPDRRKSDRPGSQIIDKIVVPNTLNEKAHGIYDPNKIQNKMNEALNIINEQKIERHIFQVNYLIERIVPVYHEKKIDKNLQAMVLRLLRISKDIVHRIEKSKYEHIIKLAETLETVAGSLWNAETNPSMRDVDLLPELGKALNASLKIEDSGKLAVEKIKESVQNKYQ